ncbi:hypothetical protein GCM10009780_61380 [Actinomadura alba]
MGKEHPIDEDASAGIGPAADHRDAGEDGTGEQEAGGAPVGLRPGEPGPSASDEFVELSPWASAFASLVGVPIWVPTEGRPDR